MSSLGRSESPACLAGFGTTRSHHKLCAEQLRFAVHGEAEKVHTYLTRLSSSPDGGIAVLDMDTDPREHSSIVFACTYMEVWEGRHSWEEIWGIHYSDRPPDPLPWFEALGSSSPG